MPGVSRSGFTPRVLRDSSATALADQKLTARISAIHTASRCTYGAPRVHPSCGSTTACCWPQAGRAGDAPDKPVGAAKAPQSNTTVRVQGQRPPRPLENPCPPNRGTSNRCGGLFLPPLNIGVGKEALAACPCPSDTPNTAARDLEWPRAAGSTPPQPGLAALALSTL